ncbi:beta-ketoacyl synthase N-terminal-like domain-containing protein [Saccharothrix sp. NRRL B-16314]|uniref:beta-ketoacyl synthase N-terminal-like domain-containing protein n=1 Tax=Saccharothrix sp. NRRL B-16314 TaxID=1463825 RepID=UPI00068CE42E|nr:beta-ketoacyl synthase N-terminal-like domain-containing protein [Saccharothrix sp. NRRL B-16314]
MSKRWAIAGVGALSSVGRTAEEMFDNLCAGRTGLRTLRGFTAEWYTAQHLHEIDDLDAYPDVEGRATRFLLDAIGQALADAGMPQDLAGVPVLIGTGLRELRSVELWARGQTKPDERRLHFGTALRERFGADDTHTFSNACSASLYALSLAVDLLDSGEHDTVVVAGTDSITESMFGVLDRLQSVPPERLRPFDVNRKGTILGEGASAIVLRREPAESGRVRGWLRGVAINCDAFHATAPEPGSIAEVIRSAHSAAAVRPDQVDLVLLHGTGTMANDTGEATAMAEVFGTEVKHPVMTAMKSMTGHTSGASGLHSLIMALTSIAQDRVSPTLHLEDQIPVAADFRIATREHLGEGPVVAQVNGFGFGGVNAVAIVEGTR